jgi:hypothetical protein
MTLTHSFLEGWLAKPQERRPAEGGAPDPLEVGAGHLENADAGPDVDDEERLICRRPSGARAAQSRASGMRAT